MSIVKIDQPGSTAPTENTDYTQQNLINVAGYMIGPAILTDWEDTGTEPDIENGTYIPYAGNIYQVQGGDEDISGTMQEGLNYVILTTPDAGDTLTAAWGTDLTGYNYNPVYQGLYNSVDALALQNICLKASTVYTRGMYPNGTLTGPIYYSDGTTSGFAGDVTGNLTGDVTGDLTGDVTGKLNGIMPLIETGSFSVPVDTTLSKNIYSTYGQGFYQFGETSSFEDASSGVMITSLTTKRSFTNSSAVIAKTYYFWRFGG